MFPENNNSYQQPKGHIEVICGSMFSGKTEELIRRIKRAQLAKQAVALFKPALDDRYSKEKIVSHDANAVPSVPIVEPKEMLKHVKGKSVIGIDEAQFFSEELVSICNQIANDGKRVIVAGLDMDYSGLPFGPIPALLAVSEYITKLQAICVNCGNSAHHSNRLAAGDELVMLGEKENYIALCRTCFNSRK